MILEDIEVRTAVIGLKLLAENRVCKNAWTDFAVYVDDACAVDIFAAAQRCIVKTGSVIVKDDILTDCFFSDLVQRDVIIIHALYIVKDRFRAESCMKDQSEVADYYLSCSYPCCKRNNSLELIKIGFEHEAGQVHCR